MTSSRVHRVMVVAILFLAGISFQATEASAAWKPARPEAGNVRVRLVPEVETDATGQTTKSSYVVLPAGETAVFLVSGQGGIRIRTRPVFENPGDQALFRLGVCFDDTTCRKFKRNSRPAGDFTLVPVGEKPTTPPQSRLLGQENVLDLDVPAVARTISIQNRDKEGKDLCLRVLLQGDLVQPANAPRSVKGTGSRKPARGSELSVQLDLSQLGYDSNAYLAPADDNNNTGELFWPVQADVEFKDRSGRAIELGAQYVFKGRIYQESLLNEYRHRLKASQEWSPPSGSRANRWTLGLEEGLTYKKSTFFGRGDETELETVTSTGDTLSLADRFNSLTLNVTPSIAWRISDAVTATGSFTWMMRDYIEDFGSYPDIYSLDQDSKEFELELEWDVTGTLRLKATGRRTDKQYDQKFSRDVDGIEIEIVAANYVKSSGSLGAEWGARYGLRLGSELKIYQNSDQYDGYWDYSGLALEVDGGWRWKEGHRLELKVRHSETDYDRAHVLNDPLQPLRNKTVLNIRANGQYRINPKWELVGRLHYKDYDYNYRAFAYTRMLAQAGVMYEF